jgi:hypothetical protein
MRYHRVRYTRPRTRHDPARTRAIKSLDGQSQFRHSAVGRMVKAELIADQYQRQGGECSVCGARMALGDVDFVVKVFAKGTVPPVAHKACIRQHRKEQAKEQAKEQI